MWTSHSASLYFSDDQYQRTILWRDLSLSNTTKASLQSKAVHGTLFTEPSQFIYGLSRNWWPVSGSIDCCHGRPWCEALTVAILRLSPVKPPISISLSCAARDHKCAGQDGRRDGHRIDRLENVTDTWGFSMPLQMASFLATFSFAMTWIIQHRSMILRLHVGTLNRNSVLL
jgi:hypothetical protein